MTHELDFLAIGAHPDDVELTIGGTIAKMAQMGRRVGILDLTRGELGTRGTPEIRHKEARAAAEVLGVELRETLDLGDGHLVDSIENRKVVIEFIRKYRPRVIAAPYWHDLHPDHGAAGRLVADAYYPSGFVKYPVEGEAWRPKAVLFFQAHFRIDPSFIVDTTESFSKKMEATKCYASQLYDEESVDKETGISHPEFLDRIEARDRHYGALIGRRYGEPMLCRRVLRIDDPLDYF